MGGDETRRQKALSSPWQGNSYPSPSLPRSGLVDMEKKKSLLWRSLSFGFLLLAAESISN